MTDKINELQMIITTPILFPNKKVSKLILSDNALDNYFNWNDEKIMHYIEEIKKDKILYEKVNKICEYIREICE